MKKRLQKKSEVLREGYVNGLKKAQRIINEMLSQVQGFDDEEPESFSYNERKGDKFEDRINWDKVLLNAAFDGDLKRAQEALKRGVDVNTTDISLWTPLHLAILQGGGDVALCYALVNKGADVNAVDKNGNTPLHFAAYEGYPEICELLLKNGADANIKNKYGRFAYQEAYRHDDSACLQIILNYMKD